MDMAGQRKIPAGRDAVWAALNDPDVLKACIPGCQELTKTSDTEMTAVAVIKVGPVSAKFQGTISLSDIDPPNGYRITGEGQGGIAGFAKGSAVIRLEEQDGETLLDYKVSADIGGKLAQLGGRLIDATAKKMSDAFFKTFSDEIQRRDASRDGDRVVGSTISEQTMGSRPGHTDGGTSARAQTALVAEAVPSRGDTTTRVLLGALLATVVTLGLWLATSRAAALPVAANSFSPDLLFGLLFLLAAAIGYLLGRTQIGACPAGAHLDRESFEALLRSGREGGRTH